VLAFGGGSVEPMTTKTANFCVQVYIVVSTCDVRSTEVSCVTFSAMTSCDGCVESEEAEVDGCGDSTLPLSASDAGCGSAAES